VGLYGHLKTLSFMIFFMFLDISYFSFYSCNKFGLRTFIMYAMLRLLFPCILGTCDYK